MTELGFSEMVLQVVVDGELAAERRLELPFVIVLPGAPLSQIL